MSRTARKARVLAFALLALLLAAASALAKAGDSDGFSTGPSLKRDGGPHRIAAIQGGDYEYGRIYLAEMVKGLMAYGWVDKMPLPGLKEAPRTQDLWRWLADRARSRYVTFLQDGFYEAGGKGGSRQETRKKLVDRAYGPADVDLILALGVSAGQDMAAQPLKVPVVVASPVNPVEAGIIASIADSGHDHIHAQLDPKREMRKVMLFFQIMDFKKLGVAYENTYEGRTLAAMEDIERVAADFGFTLLTCEAPFSNRTAAEADSGLLACVESLSEKADAIFLANHPGMNSGNIEKVLKPIIDARLPSFVQHNQLFVKRGALMGAAAPLDEQHSSFYGATIARILNGAKPRDLTFIFRDPPKIAVNLETAGKIGYTPPIDVLDYADTIYLKSTSDQ